MESHQKGHSRIKGNDESTWEKPNDFDFVTVNSSNINKKVSKTKSAAKTARLCYGLSSALALATKLRFHPIYYYT